MERFFLYRYEKHRYMLELIDIRVCIAQVRIRIVLWFLMYLMQVIHFHLKLLVYQIKSNTLERLPFTFASLAKFFFRVNE